MATTVKNGGKITSAGSSEVEIEFDPSVIQYIDESPQVAFIELDSGNSGTVQFSVNEAITADHAAWAAGSKVIISFSNGSRNIRYKASGSGQIFRITI